MLSQEALDELKAIHRRQFGEELTDAETLEMGISLVRLVSILSKPVNKGEK